jgi:hypothetical protein
MCREVTSETERYRVFPDTLQILSVTTELQMGVAIMPDRFNSDSGPHDISVIDPSLGSTSQPELKYS